MICKTTLYWIFAAGFILALFSDIAALVFGFAGLVFLISIQLGLIANSSYKEYSEGRYLTERLEGNQVSRSYIGIVMMVSSFSGFLLKLLWLMLP